jgi:hypothetical protein
MTSSRRVLWIAFIAASVLLGSCNFLSEPEAVNNPAAKPAAAAAGKFRPYVSGQRVAGTIRCEYVPEVDARLIRKITLVIDDVDTVGSVSAPPFAYVVNTDVRQPGSHRLTFAIYLTGENLGLMQIRQAPPAQTYAATLVFDPTPPNAPSNIRFTYDNGKAVLTWDPSQDLNFDHYEATVDFHTGYSWENINYVTGDRAASRCSDSTKIFGLPLHVTITVGVSNNAEIVTGTVIDTILGEPLGLGSIASSVMLPASALTVMADGSLSAVALGPDAPLVTPLAAGGSLGWVHGGGSFFVNSGGTFSFFNSTTLQREGATGGYDNLGDDTFLAFDRDGRLVRIWLYGVSLFDSLPPLRLRTWFQPCSGAGLFASLPLPDGSGYIVEDGAWMMRIGVLGDSLFVATPRVKLPLDVERAVTPDWDNGKIYGIADIGQVVVHDAETLDSKIAIGAPSVTVLGGKEGTSRGVDMKVTRRWILVLYRFRWGSYGDSRTVLIRYDKATLKEANRIYYRSGYDEPDGVLAVSGDETTCFVSTVHGQCRVDLR